MSSDDAEKSVMSDIAWTAGQMKPEMRKKQGGTEVVWFFYEYDIDGVGITGLARRWQASLIQ
jgi:hypothetical protein